MHDSGTRLLREMPTSVEPGLPLHPHEHAREKAALEVLVAPLPPPLPVPLFADDVHRLTLLEWQVAVVGGVEAPDRGGEKLSIRPQQFRVLFQSKTSFYSAD